jgi:hypothetical protein
MQLFEHTQGNLKNNMLCGLILHPVIGCFLFCSRCHMCTSLTKCVSFDVLMLVSMKTAVIWDVALR